MENKLAMSVMNDDAAVRAMFGAVPQYGAPVKMSQCEIEFVGNGSMALSDFDVVLCMTPAVRRQLARLAGWDGDHVPEALDPDWSVFCNAVAKIEGVFVPRFVRGEGGGLWLQAFCHPVHRPPSETDLVGVLYDSLTVYANPEYEGERLDVRRVEVTPEATMVAVTYDRALASDSSDGDATFVWGHYTRATNTEVTIGRFWQDLKTGLAFAFAGSGDGCTSYVQHANLPHAMRRAREHMVHGRDQRFGAHFRALDASRACLDPDPLRVVDKLRERHIPNVVLDVIAEQAASPHRDRSRFSIAQAISCAAAKDTSDPDLRLMLEKFAGEYILATPKF